MVVHLPDVSPALAMVMQKFVTLNPVNVFVLIALGN
jgi:hypothetical protein